MRARLNSYALQYYIAQKSFESHFEMEHSQLARAAVHRGALF